MVHNYKWCSTNEYFRIEVNGSKGDVYTVTYSETPSGPYAYGWSCTCMHYRTRRVECKHIRTAKSLRCGYGFGAVAGDPVEISGNTCPQCGSDLSVVSVADE